MNRAETVQAIYDLLKHAVAGNSDAALRLLEQLTQDADSHRVYAICCAIAEAGKAALRRQFPAMVWSPSAYVYVHDLADEDPVVAWAARFIVARANGDNANSQALFNIALTSGPGGLGERMVALLGQIASLVRDATDPPPPAGGETP